jgi:NCK-associated protein 1
MLYENCGRYVVTLEPWILVLEDLMTFREQALRVIMDLSSTVVTLLPNQNPLLLSIFMDLFCAFVRVNLLADKVPLPAHLVIKDSAVFYLWPLYCFEK